MYAHTDTPTPRQDIPMPPREVVNLLIERSDAKRPVDHQEVYTKVRKLRTGWSWIMDFVRFSPDFDDASLDIQNHVCASCTHLLSQSTPDGKTQEIFFYSHIPPVGIVESTSSDTSYGTTYNHVNSSENHSVNPIPNNARHKFHWGWDISRATEGTFCNVDGNLLDQDISSLKAATVKGANPETRVQIPQKDCPKNAFKQKA